MKIYWKYRDVPELAGLERSEQCKVVRACFLKGFAHWQCWGALLAFFVFIFLGIVAGVTAQYVLNFPAPVHYMCNLTGVLTGWLIYNNI